MPKLWDETVESHRRVVREAVEDAAWELVAASGLRAVTMAKVAAAAGISRATIYKYFPDVESILAAWHQRQIDAHLSQLRASSEAAGDDGAALRAVLGAYARVVAKRGQHGPELGAFLHQPGVHQQSEEQVDGLLQHLLHRATASGHVRDDIPGERLARYCRHALGAAAEEQSEEGIAGLVELTLAGLAPRDADHDGR